MGCATVSAHAAGEVVFKIPSQSLSSALNTFARQAGLQIFFPTGAIAGRSAPAISGRLSVEAALQKLIANSGLELLSNDGTTVILHVAPSAHVPTAAETVVGGNTDAATVLEEVIVRGTPRAGTLKRDSDTVVNTITELEIKRLPTLDVSDALARLPGVRRNDTQSGENRYVSIRGLNNAAASQSIDGVLLTNYVNGSRANSTELLPASFFKSVVVTTTVSPDLDENANAGHTALATISGADTNGTAYSMCADSVGPTAGRMASLIRISPCALRVCGGALSMRKIASVSLSEQSSTDWARARTPRRLPPTSSATAL